MTDCNHCPICLDIMNETEPKQRAILVCGHEFHPACILKWFEKKTSCPSCRQNHVKTSEEENVMQLLNIPNFNRRHVRRIIVSEDDENRDDSIPEMPSLSQLFEQSHNPLSTEFISNEIIFSPPGDSIIDRLMNLHNDSNVFTE